MDSNDVAVALALHGELREGVVKSALRLFRDLAQQPIHACSGLLADRLYYWQWKNRVNLATRAQRIMKERSVACKVVPPDFLLPLLEAAGNAENEEIQELWARLLVGGIQSGAARHPLLVDTLRRMSPEDAKAFAAVPTDCVPGHDYSLFVGIESDLYPACARLRILGLVHVSPGAQDHREGVMLALSDLGVLLSSALQLRHPPSGSRPTSIVKSITGEFRMLALAESSSRTDA